MAGLTVNRLSTYTGHRDCVYTLEKGRESLFYSAAGDGMVVKWDLKEPDKGQVIAKVENSVYSLHFIEQLDSLFIAENFEGIHKIDLTTNKETASVKLSESAFYDIQSHKNFIFAGTGEGTLTILSTEDLSVIKKIKLSDKSLRSIAVDPKGRFIATGYSDFFIRIFDLNTFKLVKEIPAHNNSVFTLKFSPDGRFLLSGSRDAHLKIWEVEKKFSLFESIVAHMYTINHIEYDPTGTFFATCSKDKSIKIWNASTFRLIKVIDKARHAGHGTSVNKLFWSPYKEQLISCSDDRNVAVWDLNIKEEIK